MFLLETWYNRFFFFHIFSDTQLACFFKIFRLNPYAAIKTRGIVRIKYKSHDMFLLIKNM